MARKAKKPEAEAEEHGFEDTPRHWHKRWSQNIQAAKKSPEYRQFIERGEAAIKRFRDEREDIEKAKKLNLFTSNVQIQSSITYGKTPATSVDRKFADSSDDLGRVTGEMLQRNLDCQVDDGEGLLRDAVGNAQMDYRLVGLGVVRVRYEARYEEVPASEEMLAPDGVTILADAVEAHTRKVWEDAPVDYVHWKDYLWSHRARVHEEKEWEAFRLEFSKDMVEDKFGPEVARLMKYALNRTESDKHGDVQPWNRAEIWEIWHKPTKSVFFFSEGYKSGVLTPVGLPAEAVNPNGSVKDPLGLEGFWPTPRVMVANGTTENLFPVCDHYLAKNLYEEIDRTTTRIDMLVDAVGVKGAFDGSDAALKQLVEKKGNFLVPVINWPAFAGKGGLEGAISWFPLDMVVNAVMALRQHRQETMELLFQVTGMSDLMRGQAVAAGATATEQAIKAKFGSVKLQAEQDKFARFCSETQWLRAQVMAGNFDAKTLIDRSNILFTPDAPMAQQAAELIKSKLSHYRIEVKPEAVSLTDFAAQKAESMEVLGALSGFLASLAPLIQQAPESKPFVLEIGQWALSRVRGASSMEGIFDRWVEAAKQPQPSQQGPSPEQLKIQDTQMKGQIDLQKEQTKHQNKLREIQAEQFADAQREAVQREQNVLESAQKAQISQAQKLAEPQPRGPVVPRRVR